MRDSNRRSGCFKLGCACCALPVAIANALLAVLTLSQLARDSGNRRSESRELIRELPPLANLEDLLASGELLERPLPLEDPNLLESEALGPKVGRVVLDLGYGQFKVRAADAGEPIRVEADYEPDAFELSETFAEDEAGGFVYKVSFRPKGGMLGMMFRGAGNNPRNEVEILLPRDRPLDLVGEIGLGETEIDLGGLWLREVDLAAGTGEHTIEFSEPLIAPMSYFRIEKGTGELRIRDLGNASPRRVDVEMRLGAVLLDLSGGPWSVDSRVRLDFGIGEGRIQLPEGARVEIERASVGIGDRDLRAIDNQGIPDDAPTVTLDVRAKIGELRIEH